MNIYTMATHRESRRIKNKFFVTVYACYSYVCIMCCMSVCCVEYVSRGYVPSCEKGFSGTRERLFRQSEKPVREHETCFSGKQYALRKRSKRMWSRRKRAGMAYGVCLLQTNSRGRAWAVGYDSR